MCPVSVQDCVETFIWSDTLLSILSYQHQEGQGVSPFVLMVEYVESANKKGVILVTPNYWLPQR